jgi:4-hydroxybenzoate polyprenyltransferase
VTLDRFARIHFYGYTSLWPLLGAASVNASPGAVAALLAVCVPFHFYGGVLNDVVDLDIDRTEPKRAGGALVQGRVSRWAALLFALVQVPLLFALTEAFGGTARAHLLMAGAVIAMAIYDLWSKRCPFPPLTDAAQGFAWAFMVYYAVEMAGHPPSAVTAVAAAYSVVYTLLMNGVHGCMRDLDNDLACGVRSTAIWLGIRPDPVRRMRVPRRARVYALALTLALIALGLLPLLRNDPDHGTALLLVLLGLALASGVACVWGMLQTLQPWLEGWEMVFRLHLFVLLVPVFLALLPATEPWLATTLLLVLLVPIVFIEHVRILLERLFRSPWPRASRAARGDRS